MFEDVLKQLQDRRAEILQRKSELVSDLIEDVPDRRGDTIDITTNEQLGSSVLLIETRYAAELAEIGYDAEKIRSRINI